MPDQMIELEVADDGVGMPENVGRANDPTTLGMQLVDGLVKQLDGSLEDRLHRALTGELAQFLRRCRQGGPP